MDVLILILVLLVCGDIRIRDASSAKGEGQAWGGARAQLPNWHDVPTPTNKRTGQGFRPSQRARVVFRFHVETERPPERIKTVARVRSCPNSGSAIDFKKKQTYITPCEASALRSVSEPDGFATPDMLTFSATHNRSKAKSVPAQKAESRIEKRRPKRTSDLQTVPLLD